MGKEENQKGTQQVTSESKAISIVFGEPGDYNGYTSIYETPELDLEDFKKHRGSMSISNLCQKRGISAETYMELFPDYIRPDMGDYSKPYIFEFLPGGGLFGGQPIDRNKKITWDTRMYYLNIPMDEMGLQKFADLIGLSIRAYIFFYDRHKEPVEFLQISPSIQTDFRAIESS